MISILGIPTDTHSSFLTGSAQAPPLIMKQFHSEATNKFSENGIDLGDNKICNYLGCLDIKNNQDEFKLIQNTIQQELKKGNYCVSIGGDHSITYPIVDAYHQFYPKINILHFDAHPDLYESFNNDPHSHASPFARIMENKLATSLTQIGIRTMNAHQATQVERYNIKVVTMNEFSSSLNFNFKEPVYISIDLDGLDPAYAPGVSHPEPGGLSTRDIIKIISKLDCEIIGADIVEYNPRKDFNNITAMTAAKLLKELMGKILKK